jgi:hypothetical protein
LEVGSWSAHPSHAGAAGPTILTARRREVLALMARGFSGPDRRALIVALPIAKKHRARRSASTERTAPVAEAVCLLE